MKVQLGFLEPLEWSEETLKDFSISRLGGLPVLFSRIEANQDMADHRCSPTRQTSMWHLLTPYAVTNTTLRSDGRRRFTPDSVCFSLQRWALPKAWLHSCVLHPSLTSV